MKTALVVAILAFALAGNALGASFSKRTLSDARVGTSKNELQAQITYSTRVTGFFEHHHWMLATRHSTCWAHVPWAKTCDRARRIDRLHVRLLSIAQARYNKLYGLHLAGWQCITYGRHPGVPGDPHEGHGVSPDGYRGALQMTHTWSGYTMAWESMSDTAVYLIAEKGAAAHGFDYSWMAGQWPRTYPPCADLF